MHTNVLDLLENACRKHPHKVAMSDGENSVTYTDIRKQARQIGSLVAARIPAGSPVLVLVKRKVTAPLAYLGVLYAGCFFIPLDAGEPPERVAYIIDLIAPAMILTVGRSERIESAIKFTGPIIKIEEVSTQAPAAEQALALRVNAVLDISPMCVLFTSGSTGNPKGVVISHRAMLSRALAYKEAMYLEEDDIFGSPTPLHNVSALHCLFAVFYRAASIVFIPKGALYSPAAFFTFINESGITNLWITATAVSYCVKEVIFQKAVLKSVKTLTFANAAVNCEDLKIWLKKLPDVRFIHRLGSTEAGAYLKYDLPGGKHDLDAVPVGWADKNTGFLLLDEQNGLVKEGEIGEICVKGSSLATGYWKNPELTKERFIQNPLNCLYPEIIYKTGDMGHLDENGWVFFHGRTDRMVKCKGYRVELDEIDAAARTMESAGNVCSIYDSEADEICLFYTGEEREKEIIKHIRTKLPSFMLPHRLIPIAEIPMLNPGKINYQELKRRLP